MEPKVEFKIGDTVRITGSVSPPCQIRGIFGGRVWLFVGNNHWATMEIDRIEHIPPPRPADSEPLSEEWLRRVGLIQGHYLSNQHLLQLHSDGRIWLSSWLAPAKGGVITIGDARTLCRLLGVTLERDV